MRSLLVLSIALCLGLATAAPVTDLLKALLKRQATEVAAPPPAPVGGMPDFIPSDEEFGALQALGAAIVHMTELGKKDPKSLIDFVISVGESIPADKRRALFKRAFGKEGKMGPGHQGPPPPGMMGPGHQGPPPPGMMGPGHQGPPPQDMGMEIMNEVFKNGVYETVLKYVNIMGRVLENSGAIFEWTIMGPDCTTCPPLPEDLIPILMELSGGPGPNEGPHGGPNEVQYGGPSGAQGRPHGARPQEKESSESSEEKESAESAEEDAPVEDAAAKDDALLKRLVALLADNK